MDAKHWELVENCWTEDQVVDLPDGSWATLTRRPIGSGWTVVDYTRDRKTKWQRRRSLQFRRVSRGGGGASVAR